VTQSSAAQGDFAVPVGSGDPSTASIGTDLFRLVSELYPLCRSITGDGVRETLRIIGRELPVEISEIPSGTPVLDWTVPPEWNVRGAYIADAAGHRLVDFANCNLHVVSYSTPINTRMSLDELRPHLHTIPEQPNRIPYRTSYYKADWGFCLEQQQLDSMAEGTYEVVIDSSLQPGSLTYGEVVVPGQLEDEILVSTHVCHPSLADDNLSGIAVSTMLARRLLSGPAPRHTVRFLYAPGTIGAISWLAQNRDTAARIRHGLTLTCLGDSHPFTYKRTAHGSAIIDRAAAHVLAIKRTDHHLIDFFPYGYDERQYNSPGFRLPVGSLMRGRHGQFAEYHTSGDNLDLVQADRLAESFDILWSLIEVVDRDRCFRNLQPYGEPQLGARGLYGALGGTNIADAQLAMLWVLNLSDGNHSLLDIAERSDLAFTAVEATARVLVEHQLLEELPRKP